MRVGDFQIRIDRRNVEVRNGEQTIATGRWDGRSVVDRAGRVGDDDEAFWAMLVARLVADEREALRAATVDAVDESGVDLTLIDWMLGMSPTERLHVLMRNAAALAPFVCDDLRE